MKWEEDLVEDVRWHDDRDDIDDPYLMGLGQNHRPEFSRCNQEELYNAFMLARGNVQVIVEIGVHRNGSESSTHVFLNNKLPDAKYIGIDLVDKKFLDNEEKGVYTIQIDSSDVDKFVERFGEIQIDFLFIDGWHSVNQVYKDWEYTRFLSPHGVVGFHDTSRHPGPQRFINALDPAKWEVQVKCPNDNGIGFAWRK